MVTKMATTKKTTTTKIPDLTIVAKKTATEEKESNELVAGVASIVVNDDDSYKAGADLIASIKARHAKLEELRRGWVDPLNAVVGSINRFFKPITSGLERAEEILKGKLALFIDERGAEHDDWIRRASEASKAGKTTVAADALQNAAQANVPKVAGLRVGETWEGYVVDASIIPREFLIPDVKALLAVTKTRKGDTNIPGWKVEHKRNLAVSASTDDE